MSDEVDTVVVDVDHVTNLPIEALYAELAELRARLAREAEAADRDGPEAERRSSAFWFASWKNGNRRVQELLREVERLRAANERLKRISRDAVIAVCDGGGAAELDALANEVGAAAPGRTRA